MRKLSTALIAAAMLLAGSAAFTAQAQSLHGNTALPNATRNFTPIHPAACRGFGRWCGPGFVRQCGPYRCWCRPCV